MALNLAYYASLIQRINAAATCAEVVKLADEYIPYLDDLQTDIGNEITALNSVIVSVTDLPSLLTWANAMIAYLSGPKTQYVIQQAELAIQIANVSAAIAARLQALNCG